MNFDNFKYITDKNLSHIDSKIYYEKLKKSFIDDLKTNEKYKDYFSKYDPISVESFILQYAERKTHLIEYYKIYLDKENHDKEYVYKEDTLNRFNMIKQKKLWDMQLLWRAEKIKIKEIDMSYDFEFWGDNIEACPFLSPVTEEEVEVLKQYLKLAELEFIYGHSLNLLQMYDEVLFKDRETGLLKYYPMFYQLYDERFNTGDLKNLPNIRGEKEEYYIDLNRQKNNKIREEEMLKNPPPPYVPAPEKIRLYLNIDKILEYATLFEKDPHFVELAKIHCEDYKEIASYSNEWDLEYLQKAVEMLGEADRPVYMQPDANWRKALINCAQQYKNEVIIRELDNVFEEYKMFAEMKISSGKSLDVLNEEKRLHHGRKVFEPSIFNGRELAGEPRDYNF